MAYRLRALAALAEGSVPSIHMVVTTIQNSSSRRFSTGTRHVCGAMYLCRQKSETNIEVSG